jgi:cyclohexyl-isocyanide hydratase
MTTVVIPVYNEVTQLDFTAPHQFLSMIPDIKVVVASLGAKPVTSTGLRFDQLADLEAIESCDVLCTPGGLGCIDAMEDRRYLAAVRKLAGSATYLTSVCSGSLILGAAGLLGGRRATSHWAWMDLLAKFGAIPERRRVVRDGNVITGGGVTAGMDFALTLIAELRGEAAAQCVQLALEYSPDPPFNAGSAETAPDEVRDTVAAQMRQLMGTTVERVETMARHLSHR